MFFFSGYEYFLGFLIISSLVLVIVLIVFKLLRFKICGLECRIIYELGVELIGGVWI